MSCIGDSNQLQSNMQSINPLLNAQQQAHAKKRLEIFSENKSRSPNKDTFRLDMIINNPDVIKKLNQPSVVVDMADV